MLKNPIVTKRTRSTPIKSHVCFSDTDTSRHAGVQSNVVASVYAFNKTNFRERNKQYQLSEYVGKLEMEMRKIPRRTGLINDIQINCP